MKSLVEEHYLEPDMISKTTAQFEAESRNNLIDLDEHGPDKNKDMGEIEDNKTWAICWLKKRIMTLF